MTNRTISPLRQRMVEDMNARQLGPHSQRSHIYSCERFASFLKRCSCSPNQAKPPFVPAARRCRPRARCKISDAGIEAAEQAKKQLNRRGLTEAVYQAYVPGRADYGAEIDQLQAADVAVAFIGGYHPEIGLMARLARDRAYQVQLVAGTNMGPRSWPHCRPRGRRNDLH